MVLVLVCSMCVLVSSVPVLDFPVGVLVLSVLVLVSSVLVLVSSVLVLYASDVAFFRPYARRVSVEDGQPDENDDVNDENATSRSRSRLIPGLRDGVLDPRCVLRRGRGRRRGVCIRAAVGAGVECPSCFRSAGMFLRGCR